MHTLIAKFREKLTSTIRERIKSSTERKENNEHVTNNS